MLCVNCNRDLSDEDFFCPRCGIAKTPDTPKPALSLSNENKEDPDGGKTNSGVKFALAVIAGAVLLIGGANVLNLARENPSAGPTTSSPTPTPDQSTSAAPKETAVSDWWPTGFSELNWFSAAKKLEDMDCDYSIAHGCYQIYVVTNLDCNLFVDVNFEVDGVVVDDDLDSAVVRSGQQAIMTFVSLETPKYSGSKKVRITDVTCY